MNKQNLKLIIMISFLLCSASTAFAEKKDNHEGMDISNFNTKCDVACHTPENVAKAQKDKVTVQECKNCHVGPDGEDLFGEDGASHEGEPQKVVLNKEASKISPYKNMTLIPAGKFKMGTDGRWDDEGPQYTTYLENYYIDTYEVSNGDYKIFVDALGYKKPNHWRKDPLILEKKKDHPVVYVSWHDAKAYCEWAGKSLPTQEEWEKAARGEDGRAYPWGNDFDPVKSNNPLKNTLGTEPVSSYENGRSPYGVYNLSGNVWEWTLDGYKAYPGNDRPRDTYKKNLKVLKGGSWYNCGSYDCGISAPVYNRAPFEPDVKSNSFGFRCAKK